MFWKKKQPPPPSPEDEIRQLIDQGIVYEDTFIETYGNLMASDEFLQFFTPDQQPQVKEKLNKLITESQWHRDALLDIAQKLPPQAPSPAATTPPNQ